MSGGQWPWGRSFYTSTRCKPNCVFSNIYGFVSFLVRSSLVLGFEFKFVGDICYDIHRNTSGQTFRPVVGTEIHTCNTSKTKRRVRTCSNNLILDYWYFDWINPGLEKRYCNQRNLFSPRSYSGSFDCFLHKDHKPTYKSKSPKDKQKRERFYST